MKKGFTLVELLVVIAVIGILSAIITPNLLNARNSARIAAGQRFDSSVYHSIGDYLVGEWMFDLPNSPAIDTSGFANNGSPINVTYATTSGYNGKGAYFFDDGGDRISISSSQVLKLTDKLTISAWIKANSSGALKGVIVSKYFQNTEYTFKYDTEVLQSRLVSGGNSYYSKMSGSLNTSTWYHVAVSWDKTLNSGKAKIFVNGSEVSYSQQDALTSDLDTSDNYLYIGNDRITCPCTEFDGYIDDVRIYATALSSSEIEKFYTEGKNLHPNFATK